MAQVDYFLKIDGIEGESTDSKHKDEIQLESFSFGATNAASGASGGGAGAGKVQFQDFNFGSMVSKASPPIFQKAVTGFHIKFAILSARKAGERPIEFLKIRLEDVLVSSYQSGGGGGNVPTDQVSLNFAKIEFSFQPQSPAGTLLSPVTAGFDLKSNKAV